MIGGGPGGEVRIPFMGGGGAACVVWISGGGGGDGVDCW